MSIFFSDNSKINISEIFIIAVPFILFSQKCSKILIVVKSDT